jgi:hypothetical protein
VSWPAIFAGAFVFLAIELTFGVLGTAIFAPGGVWGAGAGVWLIVLSIISMYFGARAAAHLAASPDRVNGLVHGLSVFGVSCFAAIIIATLALMGSFSGVTVQATSATAVVPRSLYQAVQTAGWWLFGAMGGAFIAAWIGGSQGMRRAQASVSQVPSQRVA